MSTIPFRGAWSIGTSERCTYPSHLSLANHKISRPRPWHLLTNSAPLHRIPTQMDVPLPLPSASYPATQNNPHSTTPTQASQPPATTPCPATSYLPPSKIENPTPQQKAQRPHPLQLTVPFSAPLLRQLPQPPILDRYETGLCFWISVGSQGRGGVARAHL
jgi:hypothetical protein